MWKYYALLSALFAALTAIFAKIGVKDINSDLATAIRTSVVLCITWGIVVAGNHVGEAKGITAHTWLFSRTIGSSHGAVVALLLQGAADGRCGAGGADRQVECGHHHRPGADISQGDRQREGHRGRPVHNGGQHNDALQIRINNKEDENTDSRRRAQAV